MYRFSKNLDRTLKIDYHRSTICSRIVQWENWSKREELRYHPVFAIDRTHGTLGDLVWAWRTGELKCTCFAGTLAARAVSQWCFCFLPNGRGICRPVTRHTAMLLFIYCRLFSARCGELRTGSPFEARSTWVHRHTCYAYSQGFFSLLVSSFPVHSSAFFPKPLPNFLLC